MLNGIDISSWQTGIDLSVVPCDFVVIKATGGIGYVNPDHIGDHLNLSVT